VAVRTTAATPVVGGVEEVPGTVEAVREAEVASRVVAVIERLTVEEGVAVEAGDLLARLDATDLRARVEGAEAALRAANAHLERMRGLQAREAATQEELEQAEAAEAAAASALEVARVQLGDADVRAPFSGWIVARLAHPGEMAVPARPLVRIQARGPLRLSATISEEQAKGLRSGSKLEVVLADGTLAAARVSVLSPASDPASRRVLVKCDLPEGVALRAGAFARLRLPAAPGSPMVAVPAAALFERGALTGVFVASEGRAQLRWVRSGRSLGDRVEVQAGLASGEEVILDPAGLTDGAPVSARPQAATP
jgi:RND family efflux transporter MFP subunit